MIKQIITEDGKVYNNVDTIVIHNFEVKQECEPYLNDYGYDCWHEFYHFSESGIFNDVSDSLYTTYCFNYKNKSGDPISSSKISIFVLEFETDKSENIIISCNKIKYVNGEILSKDAIYVIFDNSYEEKLSLEGEMILKKIE